MLKDENKNRLYFKSDVFRSLMKEDDRGIGEIIQDISEKAHISKSAIKKWREGKNAPSDMNIVNVVAEVLGVEPEILITRDKSELNSSNKKIVNVEPQNHFATDENITVDLGDAQRNRNEINNSGVCTDLSWTEIRTILKAKPVLRYKIRNIIQLIYGYNINLSWSDKINLLYLGKKEGDELQRQCLSYICHIANMAKRKYVGPFAEKGKIGVAINQKTLLRNRMEFLEISKGLMIAYLRDFLGYRLGWLDLFRLFYCGKELSFNLCNDIDAFMDAMEKLRLERLFPVNEKSNVSKFKPLNVSNAINYVTWAIPVVLTTETGFLARKSRINDLYKFEKNSGIKLFNRGNIKLLSDTSIFELHNSIVSALGCPVIMNDNSYRGDNDLKERVETYAYENNISIIYLKEA